MRTRLRRRLRWLRSSETAYGFTIPAMISTRVITFAVFLPFSAYAACRFDASLWLTWNLALLLLTTGDDVVAHKMFHRGMVVGRHEFVAEAFDAWHAGEIDPREYLQREVWFGTDSAFTGRSVRRSVRVDPPESG